MPEVSKEKSLKKRGARDKFTLIVAAVLVVCFFFPLMTGHAKDNFMLALLIVLFVVGLVLAVVLWSISWSIYERDIEIVNLLKRSALFRQGVESLTENARAVLAKAAENNLYVNSYRDGNFSTVVRRLEVSVEHPDPKKAQRIVVVTLPDTGFTKGRHVIAKFDVNLESGTDNTCLLVYRNGVPNSIDIGVLETFEEKLQLLRRFVEDYRFFNV